MGVWCVSENSCKEQRHAAKPKLNPDEILKAEYNYIASTVFQANEDRSRVASFYLVSVGSLVAAILSAIFSTNDLKNVSLAFSGLFVVLTSPRRIDPGTACPPARCVA